jgi:hypothetical protein
VECIRKLIRIHIRLEYALVCLDRVSADEPDKHRRDQTDGQDDGGHWEEDALEQRPAMTISIEVANGSFPQLSSSAALRRGGTSRLGDTGLPFEFGIWSGCGALLLRGGFRVVWRGKVLLGRFVESVGEGELVRIVKALALHVGAGRVGGNGAPKFTAVGRVKERIGNYEDMEELISIEFEHSRTESVGPSHTPYSDSMWK